MADHQAIKSASPRPTAWRLRDRVFCVLTAGMAVGWAWASQYVSQEYVLTPNAARAAVLLFMPSLSSSSDSIEDARWPDTSARR